MRLLLISRAYSAEAGGMERLSFELIQELKKIPDLEVTTLIRQGTGRLGAVWFVLTALPHAFALARRADVVHLGDPVLALHGWLIQKFLHKPIAVTIHGLDVTYGNPIYQLYLKLFGQFDLCLPISQYAHELLNKSVVSCQLSVVIQPGVHDRYFDATLSRSNLANFLLKATSYKLQPEQTVLLTAGRLVKRKGHAWFVEQVLPKVPTSTVYVIAGDGPEKNTIQETAKRVSIASRVIFVGRVSDADLKILYNTVDAFVQPNIPVPGDAEGFGLVLLEAALCQRPVFAPRLDGIPDAIHDGKNGMLLPAGDAEAWRKALTNRPLSPSATTRGYTLAHFSWPRQAQRYYQAFQSLLTPH